MSFISEDKKTITLPVPLGTIVYRFHTDCNDACTFQKTKFNAVFPPIKGGRCSQSMPCHTKLHSVEPIEVKMSNIHWILDDWHKNVFETEAEARKAGEELVELHKKQIVELGMEVVCYRKEES